MVGRHERIFAGLSNAAYSEARFDFGHDVVLTPTYAHLFASNMMAFGRAADGQPHPAPWRAVRGGFGYDVEIELAVPKGSKLPGSLTADDTVWLIAALLRLSECPQLMVPVISNVSFKEAATAEQEPILRPFETQPRIVHAGGEQLPSLRTENLSWVKSVWPRTAELIRRCPPLDMALRAVDACTVSGRPASALLLVWGALEELFAPARAELRFRVSANIAAYLEPSGPKRLELFKTVSDLYTIRSKAAHTAQEVETDALVQSFVILRNALIKMIDDGSVPTPRDLERRLFCGEN